MLKPAGYSCIRSLFPFALRCLPLPISDWCSASQIAPVSGARRGRLPLSPRAPFASPATTRLLKRKKRLLECNDELLAPVPATTISSSSESRPQQLVFNPTFRLPRGSKCAYPVVFELVQPSPIPSPADPQKRVISTAAILKKYRDRPLPPLPPAQSPSLSLAERRASSSSTASTDSSCSDAMSECLSTLMLLRMDAVPVVPSEWIAKGREGAAEKEGGRA